MQPSQLKPYLYRFRSYKEYVKKKTNLQNIQGSKNKNIYSLYKNKTLNTFIF